MLQKIQRFGGAMFAPAMLFSISGLMVGISALATTVDIVGDLAVYGTPWYVFWTIIQRGSWTVFKRLPLLFAVALPIGLAQKQPARCCLEALVAYFAYCFFLSEIIKLSGDNLGLKYPIIFDPRQRYHRHRRHQDARHRHYRPAGGIGNRRRHP
ncbi:MAG: hypothetical protein ACLRM9_05990 [Collinsella aerofaciens]